MEIEKKQDGNTLRLKVTGRLEFVTSPRLEAEVKAVPPEVTDLVFDFAALEYVASAGLRVILLAQKLMQARKGTLRLAGVNASVKNVLDITGFSPLLTFA